MNENNKHTWCYNAEYALRLTNDYRVTSCCMMKDQNYLPNSDKGKKLIELYNKPELVKIRNDLKNGVRNQACSLCWQEEDAGRDSKRIRDNKIYLENVNQGLEFKNITSLELNLGSTCNIKCRTCNPFTSSFWGKEYYDLYESKNQTYNSFTKKLAIYHENYDEESSFWDDLENQLPNIRQLVFYGGEPFLSKKMWKILGIAVEKGYAPNITLEYNTNGSIWPKETEYWKHFKQVRIAFSIDGIGEQFNYMRYPANWDVVSSNMVKVRNLNKEFKNIYYTWCITLSTLNVFYVNETVDEAVKNYSDFGLYLNLVHGPKYFNIKIIPDTYKEIIIKKLEKLKDSNLVGWYIPGIVEFIKNGKEDLTNWDHFIKTTKIHDEYRNQDFAKTFSEYASIIGFENE